MPEFKCRRCGRCCGIVPFNKTEYNAIRDIAKKMHISFVKTDLMGQTVYFPKHVYKRFLEASQTADREHRLLDNQLDGLRCPFLEFDSDGLSRCVIYDRRPGICRMYGRGGHPFLTCPNNPLVTPSATKGDNNDK